MCPVLSSALFILSYVWRESVKSCVDVTGSMESSSHQLHQLHQLGDLSLLPRLFLRAPACQDISVIARNCDSLQNLRGRQLPLSPLSPLSPLYSFVLCLFSYD